MFAPESKGAGLLFALGALLCWGSWSTALVLTGERMAFELFYLDFAISFLLTGIVGGFIVGSIPSDNDTTRYIDELFGHGFDKYLFSMLGGLMWNMANILLCKGIGLMGQALGFPMCVGLGLISGSVTNYIIAPGDTKAGILAAGDVLALLGICAVGFLANRKDAELAQTKEPLTDNEEGVRGDEHQPSMMRKFLICLTGGLLLGLSNIGVVNATSGEDKLSAPTNQTFFSLAVFASSAVLVPLSVCFPLEGHKPNTTPGAILAKYKDVQCKDHLLAFLGGFLLCCGFFCYNIGNGTQLGSAATYSIGQSAPVVGILWGTFFFKEFSGTSCNVQGIIPVVVALFLGAIVCLAMSG